VYFRRDDKALTSLSCFTELLLNVIDYHWERAVHSVIHKNSDVCAIAPS